LKGAAMKKSYKVDKRILTNCPLEMLQEIYLKLSGEKLPKVNTEEAKDIIVKYSNDNY